MPKLSLGSYAFYTSIFSDSHKLDRVEISNSKADVMIDRVLHRWLSKIFHERSCLSSGEIKELLRVPGDDADSQSSIIKVILTRHFSKEELGKFSLLWIAILGCYQNSAELLVRSGADVCELLGPHGRGEPIDEKWTVLHVLLQIESAPSRNERLVRLIMDQGVDVQARDSKGQTVLHVAASRGRVQAAEMLLEKLGADANAADDEGVTALLAAAGSRKADELLPLLMKRGADVLAKDTFGRNVLHYLALAPMECDVLADLARVFIEKGVSIDDRDRRDQYQPIHVASFKGKSKLVELYLDHGANVNALAHYDYVPLYLAALSSKLDTSRTLRTLLERGANVNARTRAGRTALHEACENFSEANIKILLYADADLLIKERIAMLSGGPQTPLDLMHIRRPNAENPGVSLALKTLALKKVLLPSSIELTDEMILVRYPEYWDYYRDCVEQVERTKSAKFFGSWTFFDVLEKCHCQIAKRMGNLKADVNEVYDMTEFPRYAEDIVRTLKRVEHHRQSMLKQEEVITDALYDMLPSLIVRRVVHYMFNCGNVK